MRYFIQLAYDGTHYHGWQKQLNAKTVQEKLEICLSTLLKKTVEVFGCGRTDTGVHAKDFYAHFNTNELPCSEDELLFKLNRFLPSDIVVFKIFKVADDFHARFDAKWREYEYLIVKNKNPFLVGKALLYTHSFNLNKMKEAAELLSNYTDFQCFSKVHTDVNNFLCTIHFAQFEEREDILVFKIRANRFLRNMVRAIVGTLLEVGKENVTLEEFKKIIESKNRSEAGSSIAAHGLYLVKVEYDFKN